MRRWMRTRSIEQAPADSPSYHSEPSGSDDNTDGVPVITRD